jgi:ATP-binding protein involved in chromosome partitioning
VLDLFGEGGGAEVARALSADGENVPLLASVPLSPALRRGGDQGLPVVLGEPDDIAARTIAGLAERLAHRGRGLAGRTLPLRLS